jgi:hypothetical protein
MAEWFKTDVFNAVSGSREDSGDQDRALAVRRSRIIAENVSLKSPYPTAPKGGMIPSYFSKIFKSGDGAELP